MKKRISNKPKAAILTWCDNNGPTNYGQILQCYAMQYLVKEAGYEPVVVQYRRKNDRDFKKHNYSNKTVLGRMLNERYEKEYNLKVVEGKETPRVRRFKEFIEKYIPLSAPCYTKSMVEDMTKECVLLICGSDQIWNPIWYDPIWFLDFGTEEQKRIAYAPSGVFYERQEFIEIYRKMAPLIEKLDEISVREQIGADILKKYVKREIKVQKDPTLHLDKEQWDQIADKRLVEEEYIFCYTIGSISPYQLILRALKERHRAKKVVYIPSNLMAEKGFREFEKYEDAGPAQFLSLIKYAKAVCTDSFHGTVLAMKYEVPFYNVARVHRGTEAFGGRERIENMLREQGIVGRWIKNVQDVRNL